VQYLSKNTVAMHWQRHKVGAAHFREMAEKGETMPVCIAIGGDPASMYSASAPLPPTVDEFIFAGFLRKAPVQLAKAITCDLEVPADAEFVLEGYIDPREALVTEGPFGDHTGFYSEADLYPQVHITAVTMRKNPIYATTIVGRPPMEDYYLGHATERIFLPLLKLTVPEIVDYHMPAEGVFHNLVFVSIKKEYPGQAYKVMNAMWGQGLMSLAKVLVIVDEWVNVRNPQEAWWVALNNIDPERDVRFTMGPVDVLDHASRAFTYGSKMGLDATKKLPEEGFSRNWPPLIAMDAVTKQSVDVRRRVATDSLCELRETAAHGVCASVCARRRNARDVSRGGNAGDRRLCCRRIYDGAVCSDGVQPHRGPSHRCQESAHADARDSGWRDDRRRVVGNGGIRGAAVHDCVVHAESVVPDAVAGGDRVGLFL
jgi:4-hydroxy-3-polyprenylbenzoate decarboxylase